jgi:hypothetical protein
MESLPGDRSCGRQKNSSSRSLSDRLHDLIRGDSTHDQW